MDEAGHLEAEELYFHTNETTPTSTGANTPTLLEKMSPLSPDNEAPILVVGWDVADPLNPRNMSLLRKWVIVLIVATSCSCFTCTSSIYTTIYGQTMAEFGCSQLVITVGLSLFVLGMAFGPVVFGGLSEYFGRRNIFIVSFTLFSIFLIPCALAKNLAVLFVFRFISGLAGSAFLSVSGGTVMDLFDPLESQAPLMIFTASPFIGPVLGPLLGGFINENANWRWSFYVMLIWSGTLLLAVMILVPETYHPVLLKRKAEMKRETTGDLRWKAPSELKGTSERTTVADSLWGPFRLLLTEPKCLCLCIYTAILLGIIYLFFGAFDLVFENLHQFSPSQVGLAFIGMLIGIVAAIMAESYCRKGLIKAFKVQDASGPEHRLYPSLIGAPLVPVGLFTFGWTLSSSIHWIVPIIGSSIFAGGTVLVYCGVFSFLMAEYPAAAASALSANAFLRCGFAAAFPLFGIQMYKALGYSWATSVLGFATVVMTPFPFLFYVFGSRLTIQKANS